MARGWTPKKRSQGRGAVGGALPTSLRWQPHRVAKPLNPRDIRGRSGKDSTSSRGGQHHHVAQTLFLGERTRWPYGADDAANAPAAATVEHLEASSRDGSWNLNHLVGRRRVGQFQPAGGPPL